VLRPSKTLQQLLGQQWCHEKLVCPKQCGEEGYVLGRGLLSITV
jgi:hypothetical protein